MRARTFFYVCAGLFLLALAYHLGARSATAQGASATQEVAALSGSVSDGGTIPLPRYQDGTEALESECRWTVSPQTLQASEYNQYPVFQRCSTVGRTVRVYWCGPVCVPVGDCVSAPPGCPGPMAGTANYMIIAVRVTGPVPARQETWGQLKKRYR